MFSRVFFQLSSQHLAFLSSSPPSTDRRERNGLLMKAEMGVGFQVLDS